MRIMNARNFRAEFWKLHEPVAVVSKEKVVGVWTPTDHGELMGVPVGDRVVAEVMGKIGVDKALGLTPVTNVDQSTIDHAFAQFRPASKPGKGK